MYDAALVIGGAALLWTRRLDLSGMPLLFACLGIAWCAELLPLTMYSYGPLYATHVLALCAVTDLLSTIVHAATHKRYLGQWLYESHCLHHKHIHPSAEDAFATGLLDALVQLVLPLFCALWWVCPNRVSAIVFGLVYSQHLLHVHTADRGRCMWPLVDPAYHRRHHKVPNTNYSHFFAVC